MNEVSVGVFSFNRPRMVREALESVKRNNPGEIWLLDDGSDCFDAGEMAREFGARLIEREKRTPQERFKRCGLAEMGNELMERAGEEWVMWLCDDDLMAEGWLDVMRGLELGGIRMVIGGVWEFSGDDVAGARELYLQHPSRMTTGNFVHRRDVGVKWGNHLSGHDNFFVQDLLNSMSFEEVRRVPERALLYRRHEKNLARWSNGTLLVDGILGEFGRME